MGEEGEKLRWFLLPSEAARLLNGKQLNDYPVKAPFTPLQWKNGLCVPQGAHLTGAHYIMMESSDRTSVAPIEKCTTLREDTEERDLNGVTNCGCIAKSEISKNMAEISISSGDKCNNDAERLRDLPGSADLKENQTTLANLCSRSLEDPGNKSRFNAENMDVELTGEDLLSRRRNHGKVFDETRVLYFPEQEKTITSALVSETSLNGPNNDCGPLIDSETTSEMANSFDKKINLNTSSREGIVPSSEGSEAITISEAVCGQKPRKKKQNEVTSGKPKFHHPPKSIFKPATQV